MRWSGWPNSKFFVAGILVAVPALVVTPVRGQVPGDWDGDGTLDPADAIGLAQCLTGPAGSTDGACASTFDPSSTGIVAMSAALGMQVSVPVVTVTNLCTRWDTSALIPPTGPVIVSQRGWAGFGRANSPTPVLYGTSARIDTYHTPTLCQNLAAPAWSFRWASLVFPLDTLGREQWFQTGIGRERNAGNPVDIPPYPANTDSTQVYSEVIDYGNASAPQGQRLRWRTGTAPTPNANFEIRWRPTWPGGARVFFGIDSLQWDTYLPSTNIGATPANSVQFLGETLNIQDRLAGSSNNHFKFRDLQWAFGSESNFIPMEYFPTEIVNTAPGLFMYSTQYIAGDAIDVWDWRP